MRSSPLLIITLLVVAGLFIFTASNADANDFEFPQQDRVSRENFQTGDDGPRPPRPPRPPHSLRSENPDMPPPPPPPMPGMMPGMGRALLHSLDLSEAQREQIHQIHEAERVKIEPLMAQLRANREALDRATAQGQFDENTVRSIAGSESQTRIELVVSHERVKAAIYQVLTPEQRNRLSQLEQEHHQHRPGPPPMRQR